MCSKVFARMCTARSFIFSTQRVKAQMMTVQWEIFTLLLYSAYSTVSDSWKDLSLPHIQQTADVRSGEMMPKIPLLEKAVVFRDEKHYEN